MDNKGNHPYEVMSNDLYAMQSDEVQFSASAPPAYTQQPALQSYTNNNPATMVPLPPPAGGGAGGAPPPPMMTTITTTTGGGAAPGYPPLIGNPSVGPNSTELNCPQCRCRIKTRVTHRSTAKTHIACLLLSWTCCCCCLPYCMDSCRNANHFCPMCGAFIGTYQS